MVGPARIFLLTTAAVLAGPASAQEATTLLGRLILGAGAQKVAIETPQAVTVVDQEDIDRQVPSTVPQMIREVPGVSVAGSDRPLGFAFNIRGIGATEQTASEARIIVNVDGVPKFYEQYRLGQAFTDPELYRRVEILRGPASSTLYGSGAIGGVVNFETKDASDFIPDGARGALRFKLGGETNGAGGFTSLIYAQRTGPGAEFLASLGYRRVQDYREGGGRVNPGSNSTSVSGLLKGTFRLGDSQTLRLSLQRWDSRDPNATLAQTGGGAAIAGTFGSVNRSVQDTTLSLGWEAATANPFFNPRVSIGWSDTTVRQRDATGFGGPPGNCLPVPSNLNVFCDVTYAYRTLVLRTENRATMQGAGWSNYLTFGLQWQGQERIAASAGPLGFHPEGRDEKLGLYAQSELVIGERLTIIPGIRVDFGNRRPGADVPGGAPVSDSATSPKLAILYKIDDRWSVFGSAAYTERLPTLDELYSFSATKAPALDLRKERATAYELGVAFSGYDLFAAGDALQFKLTGFDNRLRDLITTTATADTVFHRNVARARIWGAEIEGAYETDRFFTRVAASYVNSHDPATGRAIPTNPQTRAVVTLGARMPQRGLEFGWRATAVAGLVTATRSTATGAITTNRTPGYALHDLFLSWKPQSGALEGFDIQFALENAFDRDYRDSLALDRGRGRNFKITLARSITW